MFAALLGPALSFGSSLISGLGARQSAKKQQKMQAAYEYQNYLMTENFNAARANLGQTVQQRGIQLQSQWSPQNVARDAANAGFNPVSWANAFGGMYAAMQQMGVQSEFSGLEMQVNQQYLQNAPTAQVPSTMEAFGGALQAGVNTFLSDQRAADSRNFQREQLATQIAAIQANGGRATSQMGVPASQRTFFGSGQIPYAVSSGQRVSRTVPGQLGFSQWEPGKVDVTDPYYSRAGVAPVADAGVWTQRYGESELLEMAVAGKVLADDWTWKNYRNTAETFFGNKVKDVFGYPVYDDFGSRRGAGVTDNSADFWSWDPGRNWRAVTRNVPDYGAIFRAPPGVAWGTGGYEP